MDNNGLDWDAPIERLVGQRITELKGDGNDDVLAFLRTFAADPHTAAATTLYQGVVTAYKRGVEVQSICDIFGVTRTEVAIIVRDSGARRGMDTKSMPPEQVAALYSLLYAAQLEIERLRAELEGTRLH